MNLNAIVTSAIGTVNPTIPVGVQISVGQSATAVDGIRAPIYATPGALTGSIGGILMASSAGTTLNVATVITGSLQPGDLIAGTDGINTLSATVVEQTGGVPGGVGTYEMSGAGTPADLSSCEITSLSTVLNVTDITQGVPQVGQTITDTGDLLAGTMITEQLSGDPGGIGTYSVSQAQTIASEAMTTSMTLQGQIQPISWKDLQQLDGLNVQGARWKIYLSGEIDGLVRVEKKGGDLITLPIGTRHAGVWLVVMVLEQFQDWVCAAIVLQDGA